METLDLYYIDLKYIRDLSRVDDNVMSISPQRGKENRPFVGIVVLVNGQQYCIPLTSPKAKFQNKKSQIDFIKIFDDRKKDAEANQKLIGVLNINNMIPVHQNVIKKIDLRTYKSDSPDLLRRKSLMQKQITWCRDHVDVIKNRSNKVYSLVVDTPEKNINLTRRSSKFDKLEYALTKYLEKTQ